MTPSAGGWTRYQLGELFDFSNGVNASKAAYGKGVPFANVMEVIANEGLTEDLIPGRILLDLSEQRRYEIQRGDVLFNRTSETPEEVGLASTFVGDTKVVFGGFVLRGRPKSNALDVNYSKYALRSGEVRRQIVARGQGGIRANIGQRDLASVVIDLPANNVQVQVARMLDDASELVANLERLIAKKRDVAHGITQSLLTGKIRLSGFDGTWTNLEVAAHSHMKARIGWQGLTTAEYRSSGSHLLVGGTSFKGGRVDWSVVPYVDKWRYDQDPNIQLQLGDVLLTKDGTIGKVAYVDRLPGPATLNSGVFIIRPRRGAYDSAFLYCLLTSRAFSEFVGSLSAGSTINHLYQRDLITLEFQAPSDVEEQRAIASVIMDTESEIAILNRRLRSARAIKQGMMQKLLTARETN